MSIKTWHTPQLTTEPPSWHARPRKAKQRGATSKYIGPLMQNTHNAAAAYSIFLNKPLITAVTP